MRYFDRAPPSALLIVASAFWGAGTVLNKSLLASLSPVTLLFLQLAPSAAALWAATLLSRVRLPRASLLAPIAMLGLLNPGIAYTLSLIGLSRVSASWRLFALMAVGAVGVVLVADLAHGFQSAGAQPIGVLFLLWLSQQCGGEEEDHQRLGSRRCSAAPFTRCFPAA